MHVSLITFEDRSDRATVQVGYEDTVGSRPPPPRTRGSSRAAAASLREAEDKKRLLERMAGAIGGVPRGTQDALLGD